MAITRPRRRQRQVKVTIAPTMTINAGSNPKATVSVNVSNDIMPRVILRTVAPAKELVCHSTEKRCTFAKASRPMAVMARALIRLSKNVTIWREDWNRAPRPTKMPSAWNAGQGLSRAPLATASTSRPDAIGTETSISVEPRRAATKRTNIRGDSSQ